MPEITDSLIVPFGRAAESALGQYTLLREAGRGGMSVVYEARHAVTGRTVALKVLAVPPGLSAKQAQDMQARFEREAHAVAGLSHPNIVFIHELGEQDGRQFLVMEYLRGETLRERLGRSALTPSQALTVLRQIADAVDAVHAQGVVHRDIKPSNVMLLLDGTAKLLDFGIARQSEDATITNAGVLVGSPAYMAPEQVRGESGTHASDLWALGALLYEMLAGHPPFTGKNIPAVLYKVSHENPAPIAGLPPRVQRVLRRALDKNPARRYPSARALAESLAAAVSPSRILPSWRGRQWAAFTAAAVLLLGLGGALLRPQSAGVLPSQDQDIVRADVSPLTPTVPPATPSEGTGLRTLISRRHLPGHRKTRTVHHRSPRHHSAPRKPQTHRAAPRRHALPQLVPLKHHVRTRRPAHKLPAAAHRTEIKHNAPLRRTARTLAAPTHAKAITYPKTAPTPRAERPWQLTLIRLPVKKAGSLRQQAAAIRRSAPGPSEVFGHAAQRLPQPPRPQGQASDEEDSARLQKFIWPVGR